MTKRVVETIVAGLARLRRVLDRGAESNSAALDRTNVASDRFAPGVRGCPRPRATRRMEIDRIGDGQGRGHVGTTPSGLSRATKRPRRGPRRGGGQGGDALLTLAGYPPLEDVVGHDHA